MIHGLGYPFDAQEVSNPEWNSSCLPPQGRDSIPLFYRFLEFGWIACSGNRSFERQAARFILCKETRRMPQPFQFKDSIQPFGV
jgi:hypothetical protein